MNKDTNWYNEQAEKLKAFSVEVRHFMYSTILDRYILLQRSAKEKFMSRYMDYVPVPPPPIEHILSNLKTGEASWLIKNEAAWQQQMHYERMQGIEFKKQQERGPGLDHMFDNAGNEAYKVFGKGLPKYDVPIKRIHSVEYNGKNKVHVIDTWTDGEKATNEQLWNKFYNL